MSVHRYINPGVYVEEASPSTYPKFEPLGHTPTPLQKQWEHDCDKCKYLGTLDVHDGYSFSMVDGKLLIAPVDFYVCDKSIVGRSYIARRSSEPSEYESFPECVVGGLSTSPSEIHRIIYEQHRIDTSVFKSSFGFAVEPVECAVEVFISPFIDARIHCYVNSALSYLESFKSGVMLPSTFHRMVARLEELVRYQQSIGR